jgi:hypothetical protein
MDERGAVRRAVRNNAAWCAALCRTHGITGTFGDAAWWSPRRTPPYYPDAVTLRPGAVPRDVLPHIDTASPGCSVKDSFGTLDLRPHGFTQLAAARWLYRPAVEPGAAGGAGTAQVRCVTDAGDLAAWQRAWHGGAGAPPDVFRAALLADPAVRVLAVPRRDGGGRPGSVTAGGAVLNSAEGAVGVTNVFACSPPDGRDGAQGAGTAAVWGAVLAAAAREFPGLPLVCYQQVDDLAPTLAAGFLATGALRIWLA